MDSYISLDLEMTGLNIKEDRIIEIGAYKVIKDHIVEEFSSIVNPQCRIPEFISGLTGITEDESKHGPDIDHVLPDFLDFCGDLPLLGHNILLDFSFIKRRAVILNRSFEKKGLDTLKLSRKLVPDMERKNLKDACLYFGIQMESVHRAKGDAWAAHELYQSLKKRYKGQNEKLFSPYQLIYRIKKEQPASKIQKEHLIDLIKYHRIDLSVEVGSLTRNEISRLTDKIIFQYGRMNKKR